jgi:hypothetical protein
VKCGAPGVGEGGDEDPIAFGLCDACYCKREKRKAA